MGLLARADRGSNPCTLGGATRRYLSPPEHGAFCAQRNRDKGTGRVQPVAINGGLGLVDADEIGLGQQFVRHGQGGGEVRLTKPVAPHGRDQDRNRHFEHPYARSAKSTSSGRRELFAPGQTTIWFSTISRNRDQGHAPIIRH
ncbi:MAG: hypothetical protein R3C04_07330 [Hyphomonas sp.]